MKRNVMNVMAAALFVVVGLCGTTGCVSGHISDIVIPTMDAETEAFKYGKDVALTYFVTKDRAGEDYVAAATGLKTSLDKAIDDYLLGIDADNSIGVLTQMYIQKSGLSNVQKVLALSLYSKFSKPLTTVTVVNDYSEGEIVSWIVDFRDGIDAGMKQLGELE
jgi:hypothetical protein